MDEASLTRYFEGRTTERFTASEATFFHYRYIEKMKVVDIATLLAMEENSVWAYNTKINKQVIEFGYPALNIKQENNEVINVFERISGGPPPPDNRYPRWPPRDYRPAQPNPFEAHLAQVESSQEQQPESAVEPPTRNIFIAMLVIALLIGCGLVAGGAYFIIWGDTNILGPVVGIAPEPTDTSLPTETLPPTATLIPTATEDIGPIVAAALTGTAGALPTVNVVATALVATSVHLTSIAPTETPTFTPTPTQTPIPTETPTLTPTETPSETPTPTVTPNPLALRPDEEWSSDTATFRLNSWEYNAQTGPAGWRHDVAIKFHFSFENLTKRQLLLRFSESDFVLEDDIGRTYACEDDDTWTGGFSSQVEAFGQQGFSVGCGIWETLPPDVSSVTVMIDDFTSMGDLAWIIEILD